MSRKAKFTPEEKEQAVIDYLEGNKSRAQICGELCISSRTIQDWTLIYNKHGLAGFSKKMRNGSYSKEFKMNVVEEYVRGDGSSIDLEIKYDISSGLLRKWIRMYNANRELLYFYKIETTSHYLRSVRGDSFTTHFFGKIQYVGIK